MNEEQAPDERANQPGSPDGSWPEQQLAASFVDGVPTPPPVTPPPTGELRADGRPPLEVAASVGQVVVGNADASGTGPEPVKASSGYAALTDGDTAIAELEAGMVLRGRYEIRAPLGRGGMGVVYRVHDRVRRRELAVKVMLPSLLSVSKAVERFEREADIMLELAHPNIVRAYDVDVHQPQQSDGASVMGLRFFTMELLDGKTLRDWLDEAAEQGLQIPIADALDAAAQVLKALEFAHELTIHRDLKPENIFLLSGDALRIKVLDFGIAKLQSADKFTKTSFALGTAYYIAPEQQADSASVDQRADLYSVCVLLYEMLTGERPVGRFKTPTEERKSIPKALDDLVLKGLEPKPEDRFGSARELLDVIEAVRRSLSRVPEGDVRTEGGVAPSAANAVEAPSIESEAELAAPANRSRPASHTPRAGRKRITRGAGGRSGRDRVGEKEADAPRPRRKPKRSGRKDAGNGRGSARAEPHTSKSEGTRQANERPDDHRQGRSPEKPRPTAPSGAPVAVLMTGGAAVLLLVFLGVLWITGDSGERGQDRAPVATGPTVRILDLIPRHTVFVTAKTIDIAGRVDDPDVEVVVDGVTLAPAADGVFGTKVTLSEGENQIRVRAGSGDRKVRETVFVYRDNTPPRLHIEDPQAGVIIGQREIVVRGRVEDEHPSEVRIGEASFPVLGNEFEASITLSDEGANEVAVTAVDGAGNEADVALNLIVDTVAPKVIVSSPAEGCATARSVVEIAGRVEDEHPKAVVCGNRELPVGEDGGFRAHVTLLAGRNEICLEAVDRVGRRSDVKKLVVNYDSRPPRMKLQELPRGTAAEVLVVSGEIDEDGCTVLVNGESAEITERSFRFSLPLRPGRNDVDVVARDAAGNAVRKTWSVRRSQSGDKGIVVSPDGSTSYRTISSAMERAQPGDRILVLPGVYKETLKITMDLEIAGDGPREKILVDGIAGCCLESTAEEASVRGLTLRGHKGSDAAPAVVSITQGKLLLEDCDIACGGLAGIAIVGPETDPTIRGCRVLDCGTDGVLATSRCKGTIEDCQLSGNGIGIRSIDGAEPVVRACSISESLQNGVAVFQKGRGTFDECHIFQNQHPGIAYGGGANPVFRRCKIYDNPSDGVAVKDGNGRLTSCEIFRNDGHGISVENGGSPTIDDCSIHNNGANGVSVAKNGRGKLRGCDLYANRQNLVVFDGGNPAVSNCTIRDAKKTGVFVYGGAQGTFEACTISGSKLPNFSVAREGNPTVSDCTMRDGEDCGVLVYEGGLGSFEECRILRNACGVIIRSGGDPTFRECKLREGGSSGLRVAENGRGTLEKCELSQNATQGIVTESGGSPVLSDCRIFDNQQGGVLVRKEGRGRFKSCRIYRNAASGVVIEANGAPEFESCKINSNRSYGIEATDKARGRVHRCNLQRNEQGPWKLDPGSEVETEGNRK
ncbi:right-handed parallel beta-helix repeat-containing protein [Planctomycetota bacterium]